MSKTSLCERCGHPAEDHVIFHDAPEPAVLARYTEAKFPVSPQGLYCPHLDMVAGEDYPHE